MRRGGKGESPALASGPGVEGAGEPETGVDNGLGSESTAEDRNGRIDSPGVEISLFSSAGESNGRGGGGGGGASFAFIISSIRHDVN
jgi:hypothetical protein